MAFLTRKRAKKGRKPTLASRRTPWRGRRFSPSCSRSGFGVFHRPITPRDRKELPIFRSDAGFIGIFSFSGGEHLVWWDSRIAELGYVFRRIQRLARYCCRAR